MENINMLEAHPPFINPPLLYKLGITSELEGIILALSMIADHFV